MAWFFLIVAAAGQTVWTFSLKFADFKALLTFQWTAAVLGPVVLNIVAGLVNVFFLNQAFKQMPLATAFGAWTAFTLVFIKLADVLIYKAGWSAGDLFFIALLTVAIIGLKVVGGNS